MSFLLNLLTLRQFNYYIQIKIMKIEFKTTSLVRTTEYIQSSTQTNSNFCSIAENISNLARQLPIFVKILKLIWNFQYLKKSNR